MSSLDWHTLVQVEIGETRATVVGRLRKSLPHIEDGAHETPAPGVVQIAKMPQKTAEGQPTIGLHQLNFRTPAKQMHLSRAALKRRRRIVEGGRAGTDHGNLLSA